jgi:hypothetical protein
MQKVVGSNPISRFFRAPAPAVSDTGQPVGTESKNSAVTTGRDSGPGWSTELYGRFRQVSTMHQGRGRAAVQIDGVRCAEQEQQPGKLAKVEARVDAGAAPIAADGEQLILVDTGRAAWMALGRDVEIELPSARREALAIIAVHDHAATGDQPGTGLNQVSERAAAISRRGAKFTAPPGST